MIESFSDASTKNVAKFTNDITFLMLNELVEETEIKTMLAKSKIVGAGGAEIVSEEFMTTARIPLHKLRALKVLDQL